MASAFLSDGAVWRFIVAAARVARGRRYVASPYLTAGVVRALRLKRGDVLLCALSPANARNGSTDPREVKRLQSKGVLVYLSDSLHAKVYLLGRQAIVGSANLTLRSRSALDEAAVLLRDKESLQEIRAWFGARLHSPVQSEWLDKCLVAYRPPRSRGTPRGGSTRRKSTEPRGGVLLASLVPRVDSQQEEKWIEADEKVARRRLERPRLSTVESIRWGGAKRFKVGDEIVQMLRDGKDIWVYPHSKVVHVRRQSGPKGGTRSYVYVELPRSYRRVRFKQFSRRCRDLGWIPKATRTKLITDPVQVHQLLLLTSPEKYRLK